MSDQPPATPPGSYVPPRVSGPRPSTHLAWAILTLFCFWPFGVVAIVKAAQVDGLWARGQYDAARKASQAAKWWAICAVPAVIVVVAVLIVTKSY